MAKELYTYSLSNCNQPAGGLGGIEDRFALDHCSYEPYPNQSGVIAVGAIDNDGIRTSYSEGGTNLLVVAPSGAEHGGSITTDVTGQPGYSPIATSDSLGEF